MSIILGIDPGFTFTGFSVIKQDNKKAYLVDCGILKLNPKNDLKERIGAFYNLFNEKITHHTVSSIALETPFLGKNVQSFLKLGYLRGILYLLASQHGLETHEFSPTQVKQAVTGSGSASKEQVAHMVNILFPNVIKAQQIQKYDVTDAIAVTLSGLWQKTNQSSFLQRF